MADSWTFHFSGLSATARPPTTQGDAPDQHDAQRKRLHPKKVKPQKSLAPTVRAVKAIIPNKLIPKLKPITPLTDLSLGRHA
jgi:hypothetical protein